MRFHTSERVPVQYDRFYKLKSVQIGFNEDKQNQELHHLSLEKFTFTVSVVTTLKNSESWEVA